MPYKTFKFSIPNKVITVIMLVHCQLFYSKAQLNDSITYDSLEYEEYKTVIDKEFRKLLGSATNNLGTFAAFESKNSKITFSPSFLFEGGGILNFTFEGASSENELPIFQGGDLSSSFGAGFQYHIIERRKFLDLDVSDRDAQLARLRKIDSDYEKENLKILHDGYGRELKKSEDDLIKKTNQIDSINALLIKDPSNIKIQDAHLKASLDAYDLKLKIQDLQSKSQWTRLLDNRNSRIEKRKAEKEKIEADGFSVSWLSFAYGINNRNFNHFNGTRGLSQTVTRRKNLSQNVSLTLSGYRNSSGKNESFYWSAGIKATFNDDNMSDLKEVSFTDQEIFTSDSTTRVYEKETKALEGEYKSGLSSFLFIGEMYYFFLKENQAAMHFYVEHGTKGGDSSVSDLGTGFLFSFNTKDAKSVINAELFYELSDASDNDKSLKEKGTLGLRFSVPIKF